jgi:hypothetical protein
MHKVGGPFWVMKMKFERGGGGALCVRERQEGRCSLLIL